MPDDEFRTKDDGYTYTAPAASFNEGEKDGSSFYGALNMAGNVSEWCADWFRKDAHALYMQSPDEYPPREGTTKVHRGGSFDQQWDHCVLTDRQQRDPGAYAYDIGFRVALSAR